MAPVGVLVLCSLCLVVARVSGDDPVHFRIPEEQPARAEVGSIIDALNLRSQYNATDLARLRFQFNNPNFMFEILLVSGIIRSRRVIDREAMSDCLFSDTCTVELEVKITPYEPRFFRVVPVVISIGDLNDHEPTFPRNRVTLNIPENVLLNTVFPIQSAEDMDSGEFGIARYELITVSEMFGINTDVVGDETRLSIVVQEELNREEEDFYSLEIRAVDGGDPPLSGTVTVDISVGDWNDNSPIFDQQVYEAQIFENLDRNSPVVQVHAVDEDEGTNGVVFYSFDHQTQVNYGHLFGLNNRTGLVFIESNIDYETHKSFHLSVVASDLGGAAAADYARLIITILDVNDNPPAISVNTFTDTLNARVPENVPDGHIVAYVSVTDPDSGRGGNITCSLDTHNFRIHGVTSGSSGFEIVSAWEFDREERDEYTMLIQCEDQGQPRLSSRHILPVKVTDANDNAPYFQPNTTLFQVHLDENNNVADVIIKMNATDKDVMENAAIRYSIETIGDTPNDVITINLITGIIRANVEFDFETRNSYEFRVRATDQGDPPKFAETLLVLDIEDVNDGYPHFVWPSYSFEVAENQQAGASVGRVQAVDTDSPPFNEITYTLEPMHDHYKFRININTGEIATATMLDREESAVYDLIVVASNPGSPGLHRSASVTVSVLDENDNPPTMLFPTPGNNTVQVPTTMGRGYHVTQVSAEDPDDKKYGEVKYDISSGNEGGIFVIDKDSGAISAAVSTEMSNMKRQTLVLKVQDGGEPDPKITFASLNIVFNQSVPVAGAHAGALIPQQTLVIIVAAVSACLLVAVVIVLAVCCVRRSRQKQKDREHVYNVREQEAKKALSNGDRHSSSGSSGSDKSIDTSIDNKTKEKARKEVKFSVDMDDNWPVVNDHTAVIANGRDPPSYHQITGPVRGRPHGTPVLTPESEDQNQERSPDSRPNNAPCCGCQKAVDGYCRGQPQPALTQQNLDILEYHHWHSNIDRDSESGCSGTDSGRGPSEEGECTNHQHHHHEAHHDPQCGHGPCCCSSGIYARKYPLQSPTSQLPCQAGCHQPRPGYHCSCAAPAPPPPTCPHGCDHKTGPGGETDECTPLPHFQRHHPRLYPPKRYLSDCGRRQLHARHPDDRRYFSYAPSLPSLTDRQTPSPAFTSTSDSQFYPYTGAHRNYPPPMGKPGLSSFTPISLQLPHSSSSHENSLTGMSDDDTTTSGSYNMADPADDHHKLTIDTTVNDCFV